MSDIDYIVKQLETLVNIPSPSGFTKQAMESVESTCCKVHTRSGKTYTGTILTKAPAVHTFDGARTMERKEKVKGLSGGINVYCII